MSTTEPVQVGRRVVVRYRRPAGSHPPLTDVVGIVTAVDRDSVTVDGARGEVVVSRRDVVVVKAVPPAPVRRGRAHTAISTDDLERVMADGWRAVEEEWLGDWLLRASSGFTNRANSVLPLDDPGLALDQAIERAEQWYAARDLPSRFQLPLPSTGDPADDALGAALLGRGYRVVQPTLVLTGAVADVDPLRDGTAPVTIEASLTPRWLAAYGLQRALTTGVTEQVLTGSAGQFFASTTGRSGDVTALARMSIHPGWAGVQAMWVDPAQRGRGLGRTVLHALGMLARQRRLASMYLQVEDENDAAVALYASEGFRLHHAYAYLVR